MAGRSAASSSYIYEWASNRTDAAPFVSEPEYRSRVVATIDFDESVKTTSISKILRKYGVVDIDPYRSLGRNQLRIGTFPNVDPEDVESLLACLEWIIDSKR